MLVRGRRVGPDVEGVADWARAGVALVGGGTIGARDGSREVEAIAGRDGSREVEAIAGEKYGTWSFENLTETCQLEWGTGMQGGRPGSGVHKKRRVSKSSLVVAGVVVRSQLSQKRQQTLARVGSYR